MNTAPTRIALTRLELTRIASATAVVALLHLSPAPASTPTTAPTSFTWTNPLSPNLRDPQIFAHEDGFWYMAGTSSPFFEQFGESPGIKIWQSRDLANWDDGTIVIPRPAGGWFQKRFWAPEVYKSPDDGKYYLTFNCPKGGANANTAQAIALAVADKPMGPYRVTTPDTPLAEGNDASVFRDDDGKTYIFRSGLSAFEVDLPHAKVIGEPFPVLAKPPVATTGPGDWDGQVKGAPGVGLEGPCVIKIDKTYYCFYSSWGRGYEIGYATADNVRGPWTRYEGNPIYGAQDAEWAKRYKHAITADLSKTPYRQVGHGSVFTGPDGRLWTTAHAFRKGEKVSEPHLVFDRLRYENGRFLPIEPTFTPQTVPLTTVSTAP